MARPRTLGPTITFRLPIHLHEIAAERAATAGLTVNEYLAARLTDALTRQASAANTPTPATSRPQQVTPQWKASMKP